MLCKLDSLFLLPKQIECSIQSDRVRTIRKQLFAGILFLSLFLSFMRMFFCLYFF